jgi:UDP-N-acetylmuramoyl-tripeptide--D-alanyl-D-alanine ligase
VGALERRREALTGWLQRRFVGTQIFVTGSCGKSTAVRVLGALLEGEGRVQVFGHPNNDKHLLRPHRRHRRRVDFVVQEASAYGPGALARVTRTLRLDIVIVTAVGLDHATNYRGTGIEPLEAVALEKGRLAEAVHPDGTVCLNADDPHVAAMATRCRGNVLTFGMAEGASLRATNLEVDWLAGMRFDLVFEGRTYPVSARLPSPLLLPSLLGALAAATAAGVAIEVAIERLSRAQPLPQHMSTHLGNDGRTYVLDTFKASFWSTERLMDTLDDHRGPPLTVVLGDISDLGSNGGNKYRRLIRRAATSADEVILTAGSASRGFKVLDEGFTNIVLAPTLTDVADQLARSRSRVVLLKSNTSAHLERVVESVGIVLPPHP